MIPIRDLPIRKKVILMMSIVSMVTLLFVSVELVAYDYYQTKAELQTAVSTIAEILADNAQAAVTFGDERAAAETLQSLRREADITGACIYAGDTLLAAYPQAYPCQRSAAAVPAGFSRDRFIVVRPILLDGRAIGMALIDASTAPLYRRLRVDVLNLLGVFVLAVLFVFALAALFERVISRPILSLAKTAKDVSERKDYSLRAARLNNDELGMLVDSVNGMLAEIERSNRERDASFEREKELRKEAEEANRLKDQFLATLSHELRTPLTSIVGWIALIRSGHASGDKRDVGLAAIDRNARTQARLIEDLLDVSGIVSGKFTIHASDVEINAVLQSAVDAVAPMADAKGVTINATGMKQPLHLKADAERLKQAISNVLTNAVKFSSGGTRVDVRLEKDEKDVRIIVQDQGMGIPPDFLPYVFDRFRQADGSGTRAHGGLGLGLAIVRHIVDLHHGYVTAASDGPGKGSTFVIAVPYSARVLQHEFTGDLS
jgi:signal transduction histidine kinase